MEIVKNTSNYRKNFPRDTKFIDYFELYIHDLFDIKHPQFYKNTPEDKFDVFKDKYIKSDSGNWIYFSEIKKAFLIVNEKSFYQILTSRNKPFISEKEQTRFKNFNIGIVGLSVGQSAAITIARTGGCKNMKLADPDTIDPSNLNRIHSGIESIGSKKTDVVKNRILEINPYQNIITFEDGVTDENIVDFFDKDFKLDIVIDACDFFPMKIAVRKHAIQRKIPVLMTTDLGEGVLIDFERHDQKKIEPFGGRIKNISPQDDFLSSAIKLISPDFFSLALTNSISQIGQTAPTHPQLGSTVYTSGAIAAYIVRNIANNKKITDERKLIDFDQHLNLEIRTDKYKEDNQKMISKLKKMIGES